MLLLELAIQHGKRVADSQDGERHFSIDNRVACDRKLFAVNTCHCGLHGQQQQDVSAESGGPAARHRRDTEVLDDGGDGGEHGHNRGSLAALGTSHRIPVLGCFFAEPAMESR